MCRISVKEFVCPFQPGDPLIRAQKEDASSTSEGSSRSAQDLESAPSVCLYVVVDINSNTLV